MNCLWVTDRRAPGGDRIDEILDALRDAAHLWVEVREKEAPDREVLERVREARARLGRNVPLSVNRRFDIAMAAEADGVHLPADGIPLARVRANTPRGFRIGVSTHSAPEAERAIEAGADVVVIGPVFETPSKAAWGPPLGVGALESLPPLSDHGAQVFAIGGMVEERLQELDGFRDRVSGVAAVRMFQAARDPRALVERIGAL
jgi:thiamine-phosphate pyrophosphorylase